MFKKIVLISLVLATSLFAEFKSIYAVQLQEMMKKGVVVIDIRRADEYKMYGTIKNSHKLTFFDEKGDYNIPKWMDAFTKIVKDKEQPFVLVCAHANRTKVVGKFLDKDEKYKNVYELNGGINYGWIDKGHKTVR